ncbi:MAG: DUF4271 domain-containing protein [Bacteroides sp.]|nr:DUF4271 domain-containing protein [Bacteroides sp.]
MTAVPALLSVLQWQPYHVMHFLSMDIWIFLSMVFFAWAVQRNIRKIGSLCGNLFSFRDQARNKNVKGGKRHSRRIWNFSFLALSVVTVAWFLYALWTYAGWELPFGEDHHDAHLGCNYLMSVCALFALLFYMLKSLVLFVVSNIFDESRCGLFLWRMSISYDFLLSVFSFPFLMIFLYADGWLQAASFWIVAGLFAIFFIIRILKAVIVGRYYSRFSYLHIFVYFCALEILLSLSLWRIVFGL